jgi:CheY-like chemotaxis protein
VAYNAHKKNLELLVDMEKEIPAILQGDSGKIEQILQNFLSNAVKFTNSGSILLTVKTKRETADKVELEFSVIDTGMGITDDIKNSLFQPFIQGDSSYTNEFQGTGLGLAISKKLVELMEGTIGFETKIEEGSKFFCKLPLSKSTKHCDKLESKKIDWQDLRVLVVDDNPINRTIVKRMLEEEGISVFVAENGESALALLENEVGINLVILDVNLPKMDGFETAKRIAEFKDKRTLLMFTSVDLVGELSRIREVGVADYLIKPVKRKELLHKIEATFNPPVKITTETSPHDMPASAIRAKTGTVKILVAEDNTINRNVLVKMIRSCGDFEVIEASNGRDAVEIYRKEMPMLIFMDIQMPVMNGFEALEQIRAISEKHHRTVKVVALTAYATEDDRKKCISTGMDDYLAKPIKRDAVNGLLLELIPQN